MLTINVLIILVSNEAFALAGQRKSVQRGPMAIRNEKKPSEIPDIREQHLNNKLIIN